MKNIIPLALAIVLSGVTVGVASAQPSMSGPRGQRPADAQRPPGNRPHPTNARAAVQHLTEAYVTLAPFDVNDDNQLDATEKAALAQAMLDDVIQPPAHRSPPAGVEPDPERLLARLSGIYAQVAPYDANNDGTLDEAEQTTLKSAIESRELRRPGPGPRGQRPPGQRGGAR